MKTVVVVAYHFPPGGGPGVQRVLKHVTYLREFGWRPIVVTVENGDFPARDESLLSKIPSDVIVERVPILEPYQLYRKFMGLQGAAVDVNVNKSNQQRSGWKERLSEFIRATVFIPDARVAWIRPAAKRAIQIADKYNADAIYTSSPPYSCALIGRSIKRATSLPWVVGLRDPWTDFLTTPERWFLPAAIDRSLEKSVLTESDAVECAWQGIIDDARSKVPSLPKSKFHHVPNGFDSSDFPSVEYTPNDTFTVTYTGSMYGRRTPKAFLEALELLKQNGTLQPVDIHLRFVGRFGDEVHAMMDASSFSSSIEKVGYVPHAESIAFLIRSEMSLLVVDDTKESAEIVPGKVYEYLGVGRPVLALAPAGSAIETLIESTGSGFSRPQSSVPDIAEVLQGAFNRWKQGEPIISGSKDTIRQYERRESARQLAHILDGLVQQ